MRYLIDTNIFIYSTTDVISLCRDVYSILEDPDTLLCMSAVSVRELIVAYRHKGFDIRRWRTPEELVKSITDEFFISVLPVGIDVMKTYARLQLNEREEHNDPCDHLIISQALTERMPLISSDRKFLYYRNQGLDLIFNGDED